ncbi:CBS domain-containing protein [uncultured Corynebacterium sp.]|uniref:CBS domain-containing protein n=1 Tax=uncultured Corynebacterium sp. TaxID=159447 RepID=UPI002619E57F|nr:CBS domain-containing protein [uncultured Corynebacterium sp.]
MTQTQNTMANFFKPKSSISPYSLLPDTVSMHMTESYIAVPEDITVGEALSNYAAEFAGLDDNACVFLVDDEGYLTSDITLKELREYADRDAYMNTVGVPVKDFIKPEDPAAISARQLIDERRSELPVVRSGKLVGVLTDRISERILGRDKSAKKAKKGFFSPLSAFFGAAKN